MSVCIGLFILKVVCRQKKITSLLTLVYCDYFCNDIFVSAVMNISIRVIHKTAKNAHKNMHISVQYNFSLVF
jgi:hypothetical protein